MFEISVLDLYVRVDGGVNVVSSVQSTKNVLPQRQEINF
jgi:hypothetical protein